MTEIEKIILIRLIKNLKQLQYEHLHLMPTLIGSNSRKKILESEGLKIELYMYA